MRSVKKNVTINLIKLILKFDNVRVIYFRSLEFREFSLLEHEYPHD